MSTVGSPSAIARSLGLVAALTILAAGAFDAAGRVAGLAPVWAYPSPWSAEGFWTFVAVPVTGLAAMGLFLLPGLALRPRRPDEEPFGWLLLGFARALLVWAGVTTILGAFGSELAGPAFAVLAGVVGAVSVIVGARTGGAESSPAQPESTSDRVWTAWWVTGVAALLLAMVALAPKLHWEAMNGDGAHAFLSIRAMLDRGSPFWSPDAGVIRLFPGPTSVVFTFPGVWFVRLIGEVDLAARLPALLYLVPVTAGVLAVARAGGGQPGRTGARLQWAASGLYLMVMAFGATYSPYAADLALPATQDTLFMATFLGFVWSFLRRAPGWMFVFGLLTCGGLPSGAPLILLWTVAALVWIRPRPWRQAVGAIALLGLATALVWLIGRGLNAGTGSAGAEYEAGRILAQFRALDPTHFQRPLYWIVPAGLVPIAALVWIRRLTPVGRAAAALTLVYAVLFQFQARTALHYFVPAMVLPWVVVWSHEWTRPGSPRRRSATVALTAGLLVAGLMSWPWGYRHDRTAAEVGASIALDVPGWATSEPVVFRASGLLADLTPPLWDARVPDESYAGSPLQWLRYAGAHEGRDRAEVSLRLRPLDEDPWPGWIVWSESEDFALDARGPAVVDSIRALRPPRLHVPLYRIPRRYLF